MSSNSYSLPRRAFIRAAGIAGFSVLFAPACSFYRTGLGPAYEPWNFPGEYEDERLLLVHAALLASSPHNTQPWLFVLEGQQIDLYADDTRSLEAMDPLQREMYIGLGCALENLLIAASTQGLDPVLTYFPDGDDGPVARVELGSGDAVEDPLFDVISSRRTNRGKFAEFLLPKGFVDDVTDLISDEHEVFLATVEDKALMKRLIDDTTDATQAIVDDDDMINASHEWFRPQQEDIDEHRDGLTYNSTSMGTAMRFLAKSTAPIDAKTFGKYWVRSQGEMKASAIMLLSTPELSNREQNLRCGRAYQRIALWVNSHNMGIQPINQVAERRDREFQDDLQPDFADRLRAFNGATDHVQMLFRVGYPYDEEFESPRKPVDWVVM